MKVKNYETIQYKSPLFKIDDASQDKALTFSLAFLQKDSKCSLKFRLLSILILKNFLAFTSGNCFISDCDFIGVITR